ncbi:NYN domain-containing protein [Candidatus Parcubacteria bacterium]|nr:NYN domain-containing protein [Candidatus Parcubacteria bacterium]
MKKQQKNFAYIDSQNLNLGIKDLGWDLDFKKLRIYLAEKYSVVRAYIFIGYVPSNIAMYRKLQEYGYILNFKPTLINKKGEVKGNVDADLVLQAMRDYKNELFDQSIIISSDGDFYCLVDYFYQRKKLGMVMSPCVDTCSVLLRKKAKEKIVFMDNLEKKLKYKRKSTA